MTRLCTTLVLSTCVLFSTASRQAHRDVVSTKRVVLSKPASSMSPRSSPYLFVWDGDFDRQQDDLLAVLDVRLNSPRYGQVVSTVPVGVQKKTMPHHTEHEMSQSGILFANEFNSGQTFIFDLTRLEAEKTKPNG